MTVTVMGGRSDRRSVIQDNVIVARNGVRGIVKNAWVEEVQIYVTCLILLAIDDVDTVPEQMQRMGKGA